MEMANQYIPIEIVCKIIDFMTPLQQFNFSQVNKTAHSIFQGKFDKSYDTPFRVEKLLRHMYDELSYVLYNIEQDFCTGKEREYISVAKDFEVTTKNNKDVLSITKLEFAVPTNDIIESYKSIVFAEKDLPSLIEKISRKLNGFTLIKK